MTTKLTDAPNVSITVSLDQELLRRLNEAARHSPECISRSQLVRDLLDLALDVVLDPLVTLPAVVAGLKDAYGVADETPGEPKSSA